jgi:hypothetical protein
MGTGSTSKPSIPLAVAVAALALLLATLGANLFGGAALPSLRVTVSVPPDGRLPTGELVTLVVTLSTSATAVEPRFFIVLGPTVYAWAADGPSRFEGPGIATYRVSDPCAACGIPPGSMFVVRVYDVLSDSYSFSPIEES